ncbi:MAG: hypothetical protein M3Q73_03820 [bacterium]|nr:hypothetical protein [bacterium]
MILAASSLAVADLYRGVEIDPSWVDTSERGISTAVFADKVRESTTLEQVLAYKNGSIVRRIHEELEVDMAKAEELFTELKRFLWLAAVSPEEHIVPSPVIDEAWHCFVLFTQDYADFCSLYFSGFLHHAPQRDGESRITREMLKPTIDAMHREFDGLPSEHWHYNPMARLTCGSGGGCKTTRHAS